MQGVAGAPAGTGRGVWMRGMGRVDAAAMADALPVGVMDSSAVKAGFLVLALELDRE